jgi:hypothetical protein
MSVLMPTNLRYVKRIQLAEEQRLMANYYQDLIRSFGVDVLYIKRDNDFALSGVNSDTIYGQQTNATFSTSANMITYMDVDSSILALNGLGLVPQDELTFYFAINDFAVSFANNFSQYAEYPIEPLSGYVSYTATNLTKDFSSEVADGSFSYDFVSGVTSGTNIFISLSAEPIPNYQIAVNPYLHTSFVSTISGGYASTNLFLTYNKAYFNGYPRTFYSVSGYVLYSNLTLALKHSTKIHPNVGDIVRIDFPGGEQLEEYEINEVFSRRPTATDGVNPLLGKYVWKCKATRRIPSFETIANTEIQSENASEDFMDIIKKSQHDKIPVFNDINDYSATNNDKVYGGYTANDELILDPDRYIDTVVLSGSSILQSFNNGTSLLTDGHDLFYQSGSAYVNITNNTIGNIYNQFTFPVNTDNIMYLKIKNNNIYFSSALTSSDTIIENQITNFTNTNTKEQFSFDYIIENVNKVQGPANSSVYIFKSDRFALISNGSNLIAISPTGEVNTIVNNISQFNATIGTDNIVTYSTALICQINNGPKNVYIPLYTGDITGLTPSNASFYGKTIADPTIIGSRYISTLINNIPYYIKVFSGDTDSTPCTNIIGTYIDGSFISAGLALININNQQLFIEIFTKIG